MCIYDLICQISITVHVICDFNIILWFDKNTLENTWNCVWAGNSNDKPRNVSVKTCFSPSYTPGCVAPNDWSICSIVGDTSGQLNNTSLMALNGEIVIKLVNNWLIRFNTLIFCLDELIEFKTLVINLPIFELKRS